MRNEISISLDTPPPQPPLKRRRTRLYLGIALAVILTILASLSLVFYLFPEFHELITTIPEHREVLISVHVESDTVWAGVVYRQDETIRIPIASRNQTFGYTLRGRGQLHFGLELKKATDFGYLRVTVYNSSETDPETGKSKVEGKDETTEPYGMVTLSIMV